MQATTEAQYHLITNHNNIQVMPTQKQAHLQGTQTLTQSQPCKRACLPTHETHPTIRGDSDREEARTHNKSIAAIGAGRNNNQQQCISKLYIRRTEFYRSLVLNFGF